MLLITIATETYHNRHIITGLRIELFITMISKKLIASLNGVSEFQSLMLKYKYFWKLGRPFKNKTTQICYLLVI